MKKKKNLIYNAEAATSKCECAGEIDKERKSRMKLNAKYFPRFKKNSY